MNIFIYALVKSSDLVSVFKLYKFEIIMQLLFTDFYIRACLRKLCSKHFSKFVALQNYVLFYTFANAVFF